MEHTPPRDGIRVGPAGWSYADWEGIVYPGKKARAFDRLEYIASYFDLVEINSTFYRTPAPETCRGWVERVAGNPDFLFTAKVPQQITHGDSPAADRDFTAFKRAIDPIMTQDRLGAVLVQFPWSFRPSPERIAYVKTVTERLQPYPTVIEVRHGAWAATRPRAFFRDNAIALCGIDQPLIGDSLGPNDNSPIPGLAYFRLHGRNKEKWFGEKTTRDERYNYLYDESELAPWSARVGRAAAEARRVFVVLNNHFRGQAVVNALELQSMLSGKRARAPKTLLSAYPRARARLDPDDASPKNGGRDGGNQLGLFEKNDGD